MKAGLAMLLGGLLLVMTGCTSNSTKAVFKVTSGTWIQGVNHASLEYGSPQVGKAPCLGDGTFGLQQLQGLKTNWNSDMVRIPLSANNWLGDYDANHGTHYGAEGDPCPGYDAGVRNLVAAAAQAGVYIMLTLAYVDPCATVVRNQAGAGYALPGEAEGVNFWQTLGTDSAIADNKYVWLDAYSEPHGVSWEQWYAGGEVTQVVGNGRAGCTYQAAGMAELASVIRAAAPTRPIVISGNNWGGDITQIDTYSFPQSNLYFGVHIYPGPDDSDESQWPSFFANMATRPVVATEFGTHDCSTLWVDDLMSYLRVHAQGMIAWGYNKGDCSGPRLLDRTGAVSTYGSNIQAFYAQSRDVKWN
jgi:hypothetical protein